MLLLTGNPVSNPKDDDAAVDLNVISQEDETENSTTHNEKVTLTLLK